MGTTHIWLGTDTVARDLLVRRQRRYCDRPEFHGALGVREGSEVLPLMAYSTTWHRYKSFMHSIMRDANPRGFYGWPAGEDTRTLRRLLESPERWSEHLLTHCARTVAGVAWGDPAHATKLLTIVPPLLKAISPAGPLINKLPFLKYLPEAISPFKQAERLRKSEMQDAFYEALRDVISRVQNGTAEDCWSKLWLENTDMKAEHKLDFHEAAHAIGSSSFVAITTIGNPLHAFFSAMCHYPAWQTKVQEEIDTICAGRRPTLADMPNVPRLRATVKELMRWRQTAPLGAPHMAMEDDVYEGYFIPKGAILHANHHLITRDEQLYPSGEEFVPERWLDPAYPTYRGPLTEFPNLRGDVAFGYGNRACPGIDLTQTELVSLIGAILWGFNIKSPVGRDGAPTSVPWYESNPFAITLLRPFACGITVRSEEKRLQILESCDDPSYSLKADESQRTSRWDIVREEGQSLYTWEGLAVPVAATQQTR